MIKLSLSQNQQLLYLTAYQGGAYRFNYVGDTTYTDSQSVVWTWEGVNALDYPLIIGIRTNGIDLVRTSTDAECLATPGSYFYDAGSLTVNWPNSAGDWSINRQSSAIQAGAINCASRYDPSTTNFFGGRFYRPDLTDVSGIKLAADPLKLGLLAENKVTINLDNSSGYYDGFSSQTSSGAVVQVDVDGTLLFCGFSDGVTVNETAATITATEQRFYQDALVCQRLLTLTDFASLNDNLIDTPYPVCLGKVRRGILVPTNTEGLVKANSQTVTFIASDPDLGPMVSLSALYGSDGLELTPSAIDLTSCTVSWVRPANSDLDLSKFSFTGEGPATPGSNGVAIIKWAIQELGNIEAVSTNFDAAAWAIAEANNTQPVGLSIRSKRGIATEIIEPICASLQVLLFTRGDGQMTIRGRDLDADPLDTIGQHEILNQAELEFDTSGFANQVIINYSPDFVNDEFLQVVDSTNKDYVILEYGRITTPDPIDTVLYNQVDAEALATELLPTTTDPQKIISFTVARPVSLLPFDLLEADLGRMSPSVLVEVLSVDQGLSSGTATISGRILKDTVVLTDDDGNILTTDAGEILLGEPE